MIKIKKDLSEMVLIPEGSFIYGSRGDDKDAYRWEKPQQTIYLPSFYMDVYPVTNRQYCLFLNELKPGGKRLDKWIDLPGAYKKEKCRIKKKEVFTKLKPVMKNILSFMSHGLGQKHMQSGLVSVCPMRWKGRKQHAASMGENIPGVMNLIESGVIHV